MNNKENIKKEALKSIRYIIPIIVVFVGILVLKNYSHITNFVTTNIETITGILTPFFIGFIIAYILNQPMNFLEKKFKVKRGISVAIIYIVLVIILISIWLFLVPNIKSSIYELTSYIPKSIEQIEGLVNSLSSQFNINIDNPNAKLQINEFITKVLVPLSTTTVSVIGDVIINLMGTIVSYTVNIFLGIVISIYLLLSKEQALESINIISRKLLGKYYKHIKEIVNVLDKNIGVYIVAKAIDSTIYGVLCIVILSIIGSKYALLLGIVAGITNMIPFFGPIIGTIVVVVINLFFSFDKAILVLIVMIVVQQLESAVLEPYFVGKQVGVPPIFTILVVTLAGKYTGFMGILLSVPITGVILMYVKRFIDKEKLKIDIAKE
ncbi:AI-2E family transporter [Romboutsia sp.]|uniref:AI-2E family transporter n=1 Tax=Romboutsia sp. TaxID=1965302 RepID=UPI003F2F08D8